MITRKMEYPAILINFKTYRESTGSNALRLAEMAEEVRRKTDVCIALAPQFCDNRLLTQKVSLPIFAQHIDPIPFGGFTGSILPEAVKEAGAIGTLINHSERQLKLSDIAEAIRRSKELNLLSAVCANNETVSVAVAALNPEIVSVEPPELIGSGTAISKVQPQLITRTIEEIRKMNQKAHILCGAGISSGEDVAAAIQLGSEGVLLASGIVKAKDPHLVLLGMAKAILSFR